MRRLDGWRGPHYTEPMAISEAEALAQMPLFSNISSDSSASSSEASRTEHRYEADTTIVREAAGATTTLFVVLDGIAKVSSARSR